MFLKCDGIGGDRSIVNCEAIESLTVDDTLAEEGSESIWRALINTYNGTHIYGQYLDREEAFDVIDGIAHEIANEHEHADTTEPPAPLGAVETPALIAELLERRVPLS